MKRCFIAVLLMLLASPAFGQSVAPNQVIIFEHNNFVGKSRSFTLEPGMRHKLVPTLGDFNDKISSILVGELVRVWVFEHVHFTGGGPRIKHRYRSLGASNDQISSMIIYSASKAYPPGVKLVNNFHINNRLKFFPLPESKTENVAKFPYFSDYMNDRAGHLNLLGDVVATVWEHANFKGNPTKFPGAGPSQGKKEYDLETYQLKNKISSVVVEAVGDEAWKPPVISPHKATEISPQKAPGKKDSSTNIVINPQTGTVIPSKPSFDLSDTDRPGKNYKNFDLANPDLDLCMNECQKDPRCKAFTFVRPGVQGPNARCWLKDGVPDPKPSDCCISGVKR